MHLNRAAAERYNFQNQIRQATSDGRISICYSLNFNVASALCNLGRKFASFIT